MTTSPVDTSGTVLAVSQANRPDLVGQVLDEEWVGRVLALRSGQSYAVSSFAPSALYADRPTYVYGAAVRDPATNRVIGGVGIVFDSAPQFAAMLEDAFLRDEAGATLDGALTLFLRRTAR